MGPFLVFHSLGLLFTHVLLILLKELLKLLLLFLDSLISLNRLHVSSANLRLHISLVRGVRITLPFHSAL